MKFISTWTDPELESLMKVYPVGGIRAAREALPGRTDGSIYSMCKEMGIQVNKELNAEWRAKFWEKRKTQRVPKRDFVGPPKPTPALLARHEKAMAELNDPFCAPVVQRIVPAGEWYVQAPTGPRSVFDFAGVAA